MMTTELAERWVAHARDHEDLFRDHGVGLLEAIVRGARGEPHLREILADLESKLTGHLAALDYELMNIEGGDEEDDNLRPLHELEGFLRALLHGTRDIRGLMEPARA